MAEIYVCNDSLWKLFSDDLIECLIEAGLIKSQYQMSIYIKYASYGKIIVVLSYVDDCVYWYIYEALVKWFHTL